MISGAYGLAFDSARPLIASRNGIVAASHTLASAVGARILERGGNAVDAAIAANAVTGFVQPKFTMFLQVTQWAISPTRTQTLGGIKMLFC